MRRGHQELNKDIDVIGLRENLVGMSEDGGLHLHECSDEGRRVVIPHAAHVRVEPRGNLVPHGALLGEGLVHALLPLLPLRQLYAHLAMLSAHRQQHVVGNGALQHSADLGT